MSHLIYCCECAYDVEARCMKGKDIYPHREDLWCVSFWSCPNCSNYVGAHDKTKDQLGCIPTPELREMRKQIHSIIDPLWQDGLITRNKLYKRMNAVFNKKFHAAEIRDIYEGKEAIKAALQLKKELTPVKNKIKRWKRPGIPFELRWYQKKASIAVFNSIKKELSDSAEKTTHPLAVLPTGAGKSYTLCELINLILGHAPNKKILVLSHVAEILEQNYNSMKQYFPGVEMGLYSATLKSRTIKKITVAGIQSVWKRDDEFWDFDVVIIDECHLIPMDSNTMYRTFLGSLDVTCIGLTATHFRLGHGYIHEGEEALFNKIAYDLSTPELFNRLVDEKHLTELITKNALAKFDMENNKIGTQAGDYKSKDLSTAFDREEITKAACDEIIEFGKDRKLWLIFAIDIKHAKNIARILQSKGIKTACVHSKMKKDGFDRDIVIKDIKAGSYQAVVNVDVLTTGFDVAFIDLIGILRPTKSPVLHVQLIGRGLRVAEGKKNCLVLDFPGNTVELGPINKVNVKKKSDKKDEDFEPSMKECPECSVLNWPMARKCVFCNHAFAFKEKIKKTASTVDVVYKGEKTDPNVVSGWMYVERIIYSVRQKPGSPSSLLVDYRMGLSRYTEIINIEGKQYPKLLAKNWVGFRWRGEKDKRPNNLQELLLAQKNNMLREPNQIKIEKNGRYTNVVDYRFPL